MNPNKEPHNFKDNLELFARFCPEAARRIEAVDCAHLQFCATKSGEMNLKALAVGGEQYYHSQEGAVTEAKEWLEKIFPINVNVVCVFGIGLGYYYDVLCSWLHGNPGNFLVFIEDDLAVWHRFLETGERAHNMLSDTQVVVHYFHTAEEKDWVQRFRLEFSWFWKAFGYSQVRISALNFYQQERSSLARQIHNQIWMNLSEAQIGYIELFENQELCAFNYYSNFLAMPKAGRGIDLSDKFPEIPLIICGAGPSLGKQLEKLPALYDRAFIVGSGTGMNILTRRGIRPHFGIGIDPYDATESRFLSSLAYEMPFFYFHRFSHKALKIIHSPVLLFHGPDTLGLAEWFKKELNLSESHLHPRGISSSNYCNSVGEFLECNPLIFIGMDLAYTGDSSYTAGAAVHPTSDREQHKLLDAKKPNTIPAVSLSGETVTTKWEWIVEAVFFTEFAQEHPKTHLINATEGGLKILEIPDLKFDEVIEKQLTRSYDLRNWMHCEVQNSHSFGITEQQVLDALQKWSVSLENCIDYCDRKTESLSLLAKRIETGEETMPFPESIGAQIVKDLDEEPAFSQFMKHYNGIYEALSFPEMNKIKLFPDQYPLQRRLSVELEMNKGRLRFFKSFAWVHQRALNDSLNGFKQRSPGPLRERPSLKPSPNEIYELKDGLYRIHDPELELDFEEKFTPELVPPEKLKQSREQGTFITSKEDVFDGQAVLFYSSGTIKGESFYSDGQLHGPSSFYAPDGTLLARSWYIRGKRVGKTWQYYKTGELYSLQRFKVGKLHGRQDYFYPIGVLKTELHYNDDLLDGTVRLYFPSGLLKREQHLRKGVLHGVEKMWNEEGLLILEAEFNQNLPAGRSRTWHPNGQLSKEIVFYDDPLNFDLRMWNDRGQLTHKQLSLPKNPASDMLKKSDELQRTIQELTAKLKDLSKDAES